MLTEITYRRSQVLFSCCPDLPRIFVQIDEPNEADVGRGVSGRTRGFVPLDAWCIHGVRDRAVCRDTDATCAGSEATGRARPDQYSFGCGFSNGLGTLVTSFTL